MVQDFQYKIFSFSFQKSNVTTVFKFKIKICLANRGNDRRGKAKLPPAAKHYTNKIHKQKILLHRQITKFWALILITKINTRECNNKPVCSTIGLSLGRPTIDSIWAALRNLSTKSVRSDASFWNFNKYAMLLLRKGISCSTNLTGFCIRIKSHERRGTEG